MSNNFRRTADLKKNWTVRLHSLRFHWKNLRALHAVACVQTITKLWLVPSAKQRRDPCSEPPTDSTNYRKCVHKSHVWRVHKSGYTAGGPEQGSRRCFADRVNQSLISSARRLYMQPHALVPLLKIFYTFVCKIKIFLVLPTKISWEILQTNPQWKN